MEPASLKTLEFPALLDIVAGHAVSPLGSQAVRALRPGSDPAEVREAFRPVEEIMALLNRGEGLPLEPFPDLWPIWERLGRAGAHVEAEVWATIRRFLALVERVKRFIAGRPQECPVCAAMAEDLAPLAPLVRSIDGVVDEKGSVRDGASAELARLRRDMRRERARMQRQFETLLRELGETGALQESYWTVRKGRNVIPVRAGHKGRVPGLVHDASHSGETLFIEPFAIVENANRLADLEGREAEEVRRILIALGDEARPRLAELQRNTEILVGLDSAAARARYGHRYGLVGPVFSSGDEGFFIRKARHPLLLAAPNVATTPIDLEFPQGQRVVILTGPNTGGKTTTLKTLGLLCAMAQSAIPVPAHPDSRFPVFSAIFADIGDEQNLTEGLSTFSAHLRSIQRVVEQAGAGSLVLFDELGTATDPIQGAALGAAILERLAEAGAAVLATTHLPLLKQWAHEYPMGRNAATRFDDVEGRPTYQIIYDQPGASEAFRVARKLGFPSDIIDEAERRMPEGERALEAIISSLENKERRLQEELARAQELRRDLESQTAEAQQLRAQLEEAERRHRQTVLDERERILREARSRIENRIAHLESRRELEGARMELRAELAEVETEARALQAAAPEAMPFEELTVGADVYLPSLHEMARVVRLNPRREVAVVEAHGTEIEIGAHEIARAPQGWEPPPPRGHAPKVIRASSSSPSVELNLHGMRVEPALDEVERFLNRAVLDRLETVYVLVGHGRLRQAVEEALRVHSLVSSFRRGTEAEGGEAALVVGIGGKTPDLSAD